MDRPTARKNLVTGLVAGGAALAIFGLTFFVASIYLS